MVFKAKVLFSGVAGLQIFVENISLLYGEQILSKCAQCFLLPCHFSLKHLPFFLYHFGGRCHKVNKSIESFLNLVNSTSNSCWLLRYDHSYCSLSLPFYKGKVRVSPKCMVFYLERFGEKKSKQLQAQ